MGFDLNNLPPQTVRLMAAFLVVICLMVLAYLHDPVVFSGLLQEVAEVAVDVIREDVATPEVVADTDVAR